MGKRHHAAERLRKLEAKNRALPGGPSTASARETIICRGATWMSGSGGPGRGSTRRSAASGPAGSYTVGRLGDSWQPAACRGRARHRPSRTARRSPRPPDWSSRSGPGPSTAVTVGGVDHVGPAQRQHLATAHPVHEQQSRDHSIDTATLGDAPPGPSGRGRGRRRAAGSRRAPLAVVGRAPIRLEGQTIAAASERRGDRPPSRSSIPGAGRTCPTAHSSLWRKSRIRLGPGAVEFRTLSGRAMGKRPAARQGAPLWVTTADLPTNSGHSFFERLNRVLEEVGFGVALE